MTNYLRALYYLRMLEKHDYWPKRKLTDYQNRMLRYIAKYAYDNVPFYHRKINEAGVKPSDIRTVEDLKKVPITAKDEIKRNLPETVSRQFDITRLRKLRTSGSTGEPLFFYITNSEDEYRKAKHLRANIRCGQKPFDRWVTIISPVYMMQTAYLQKKLGIYAPKPISVFEDVSNQVSCLENMKPDVLDGYSNSLLSVAKTVRERGANTIKPKFLLGGAELIDSCSREFIESVFSAPFYDQYGCAELERIASQCPEKTGYHIDADSVIIQFVDKNDEEVAPGESGEIVCTSLFNYAMPFIRYAVGDVGTACDGEDCPCKRNLPLMKVIEGRKNSLLTLPSGRILAPFAIIAAIMMFRLYDHIDKFRLIQAKKDLLKLQIKQKRSLAPQDFEKELTNHLMTVLGIDPNEVELVIEPVDEIPLDKSGKFMVVVSEFEGT